MISKWEGFGLVVCEYMAAQKPIVCVPVGGVKNILNQNNSFMIEDYSAAQFAQQIIKIRHDQSKETQKIIDAAYKDVQNKYTIEIMIKNLENTVLNRL